MPKYYPKKATQSETREEIATAHNKYLLTTRVSDSSTMLYIGGATTYCLECQIFKHNPVAHLPKIEYDEKCSLTGRFERGTDIMTLLMLLQTLLQERYAHITHIAFDDYSFRECSDKLYIDLAPFFYAFYGKTWYMACMDAFVRNPVDVRRFQEQSRVFQESKRTTSWKVYDSYVTTTHPLPEDTMIELFEASHTWIDFFNLVKQNLEHNMPKLCLYMAPWITNFIEQFGKLKFKSIEFAMPVPNPKLPTLSYTSSPYVASGGTRKVQRRRKAMDLH